MINQVSRAAPPISRRSSPVNIRGYVDEVIAAGAKPVLVTPSRRSFREGKLSDNLGPWAEATRKVAVEANVPLLDLNADSTKAVQEMGSKEADTLAPPVFDYTHLGPKGSSFFAHMVARELSAAVPELQTYLGPSL